jgi:hemerythrin
MRIEWRNQLSVGNEGIDDDHKHLVCIINAVDIVRRRAPRRDFLLAFLDELRAYTEEHFAREERIQFEIGYPRYQEHKQSHQSLIEDLHQVYRQVETMEEISGEEVAQKAIDLIRFLQSWLINHIIKEDKLLTPYLTRSRTGDGGGG